MRRALLLMAMTTLLAAAVPAAACESGCYVYTLKEDFKLARRVFLGRAVAAPAPENAARFTVLEAFKGAHAGELVDIPHAGNCYVNVFQPGQTYLMMLDADGRARICGHTHMVMPQFERDIRTVRRRAAWWRSPFSSVTMFRWWIGAIVERFGSGR